jgi:VanZ family protein
MIYSLFAFLKQNRWVLPLTLTFLTLLTLVLTLLPAENLGDNRLFQYDKLGHLGMFGGWTFFLGLYQTIQSDNPLTPLQIFFCGVLFGASIEALQFLLPGDRSAELGDFLFDAVGALIAVTVLKFIMMKLPEDFFTTADKIKN